MQRSASILILMALEFGCGGAQSGAFMSYPVDPEAIRKACAMEISCLTNPPIASAGRCVSEFESGLATGAGIFFGPSASDLKRYVDCASQSSNCTDALNCASRGHGPDWCATHPNRTCDGDVVVSCSAGWGLYQTDCAAIGEHCGSANGSASCTNGVSCDPQTPARCDGNRYIRCDGTTLLESVLDCSALLSGGTCRSTQTGSSTTTGCVPATSNCGPDSERCDGASAVFLRGRGLAAHRLQ